MTPLICQACGAKVIEGARFCQKCGKEVGAPVCLNCGAKLIEGARFCQKCGKEVILPLRLEKPTQAPKFAMQKRPKMRWQVALAIILPILIVLGAFILF